MVAEASKSSCCSRVPQSAHPFEAPTEAKKPIETSKKPAEAPKQPKPPTHAATRAVRDARAALTEVELRLSSKRPQVSSAAEALLAGVQMPQYRRTYVQGCVCKTGIAGGVCCPANALGAAGQAGGLGAQHGGILQGAWAGLGGVLGVLGVASGARVMQLSVAAQRALNAMIQAVDRQVGTLALRHAAYAQQPPTLARAAAATRAELGAMRGLQDDLRTSKREQVFNFAIPGALQSAASATSSAAALAHWGHGVGQLAGHCGAAACAGGALFGLYGAALAGKSFWGAWRDWGRGRLQDPAVPAPYRAAVADYAAARRGQQLRSGWAWSSVAAAGALGAAGAMGLVAFPGSWVLIAGLALAGAIWAMVESSRTRYAPHVPVSPHMAPRNLGTTQQRAQVCLALQAQQRAIAAAVHSMEGMQPAGVRALYHFERHLMPQCGPYAFQVLPRAAAQAPGAYEKLQIQAARTWVQEEHGLLHAQFSAQSSAMQARCAELQARVDPCCEDGQAEARQALSLGQATELLLTQASTELRDAAQDLEQAARSLAVLDLLQQRLQGLQAHVGSLHCGPHQAATAEQTDWLHCRLILMQLQGTLGDAISASTIAAHPAVFSQRFDVWPLENLQVMTARLPEFAQRMAPSIDAAFLHAFFNPRRIAGEIDAIMAREMAADSAAAVAEAAPPCSGKSCCG